MRHRETTTGGITVPLLLEKRSRNSSGEWSGWTPFHSSVSGTRVFKSVDDCVTAGFQKQRKSGRILPINPFYVQSYTEQVLESAPCTYFAYPSSNPTLREEIRGTCNVIGALPRDYGAPPVDDGVLGYVVNSALSKLNVATLDVLTGLFEARDLPRTFRTTLTGVGDIAASIASRSNNLRDFHSHWLNHRYGWMPLVLTMSDAVKAFHNERFGVMKEYSRQTVPYSGSRSWVEESVGQTVTWQESFSGYLQYTGLAVGEVDFVKASFGFDPFRTTYELMTLSFVLDWFLQVGNYIEAISPAGAARNVASGGGIRWHGVFQRSAFGVFHPQGDVVFGGTMDKGKSVMNFDTYQRSPRGATLPKWNPRMSTERLLDAVALVYNQKLRITRLLFRR